ncbi:MAG: hypothetical protein J0H63_01210, partial [Rhizobiales bacterium]|nr:hypothetical protein [Hyphomicrobiales bacterium]
MRPRRSSPPAVSHPVPGRFTTEIGASHSDSHCYHAVPKPRIARKFRVIAHGAIIGLGWRKQGAACEKCRGERRKGPAAGVSPAIPGHLAGVQWLARADSRHSGAGGKRLKDGEAPRPERSRLDDAARAGWLYFVAGNTQDEIARKLNVSRPTAQRLVSLALSERLITFRLDHPIAACMELGARLAEKYALRHCDVVPTDPAHPAAVAGVASAAAGFLEQTLSAEKPIIVALGTGRTLRAAVEQIRPVERPYHQLVSLVGNIAPDGSASFFDTLTRLADLTKARHYPIPLPLFARNPEERELLVGIEPVRRVHALAARADLTLVGVGQMDGEAQQFVDGFISREELLDLMRLGAVGE